MTVLDPAYSSLNLFGARSWPAYVIADAEGKIRYNRSTLLDKDETIRPLLDRLGGAPKRGEDEASPTARQRRPKLAVDQTSGEPWVVFESVTGRAKSLHIGRLTERGVPKSVNVSGPDTAPCAPAIAAAAGGGFWLAWVANVDRRDEVFACRFVGGEVGRIHRITRSDDDAAAPALAVDGAGRVWVTYYRWNRQFGTSRDRDVFVRWYDGKRWSDEMRVSPPVPAVDDHTDPAIVADPSDPERVWIAWSWDYHSSLKENPLHVDQPTVFVRAYEPSGPAGDPVCLGVTTQRGGKNAIDLCPRLAASPSGVVHCAFDSWRRGRRRVVVWRGGDDGFTLAIDRRASDRVFAGPLLASRGDACGLAWTRQRRDGAVEMSWLPAGGKEIHLGPGRAAGIAATDGQFWLVYETDRGQIGGKLLTGAKAGG